MVKFAAAGYVCVDYYPDFNNRYYITGNGVDARQTHERSSGINSAFCYFLSF